MRECGLNGLPFQLKAYWSAKTTCNKPLFWAWAIEISDCEPSYHCPYFEGEEKD